MNKNEWKKSVIVVGRILLAYVLVFAQGAWAGQNQGTKDKAGSPQKAAAQQANEKQSTVATGAKAQSKQGQGEESESSVAEEKPSGDGRHEGIKVHGHWTIEVRNPDGSLATHREFENALTAGGGISLSGFLARTSTVGDWIVAFQINSSNVTWYITEPGTTRGAPNPGVTIGALTISAPNGTFVLTGNGTAPASGTVTAVRWQGSFCPPTVAPANCNGNAENYGGIGSITGTTLSSPVSVAAGQMIAVTVVISFS